MTVKVTGTFGITISGNSHLISEEFIDELDCENWVQATFDMIAGDTPSFAFGDLGIAVRTLVLFCDNPIHINFGIVSPPNLYVRSVYVATYSAADLPDYIHLFNDIGSEETQVRMMIGGDAVAPF